VHKDALRQHALFARLARLREAMPPGNAIARSICAANLWLRRLI
jgi:hypothetical protein